jgi:hypothetical protein
MKGGFVLEIDELVVDGVAASERHVVARALERELHQLVAVRGVPTGLANVHELALIEVDNVGIAAGDGPASIGMKAGRALYGALHR